MSVETAATEAPPQDKSTVKVTAELAITPGLSVAHGTRLAGARKAYEIYLASFLSSVERMTSAGLPTVKFRYGLIEDREDGLVVHVATLMSVEADTEVAKSLEAWEDHEVAEGSDVVDKVERGLESALHRAIEDHFERQARSEGYAVQVVASCGERAGMWSGWSK